MKAVIVAAGRGTRLYGQNGTLPKCLTEIADKKTLIDLSIENLKKHGVTEFVIVVGWKKELIEKYVGIGATYVFNPFYETTNNMASLWFAKEAVKDSGPFIYLHSDLLYHPDFIKKAVETPGNIVLVTDTEKFDEESMKVRLDSQGNLIESNKAIPLNEAGGEWVGIIKFTQAGWYAVLPEIEKLLAQGKFMDYDTSALTNLAKKEFPIKIVSTARLPWIEIDFPADLERAKKEIYPKIKSQQGKLTKLKKE